MKNNLFKKFMEFGVGSLVTLLIGFITSPIITRIISPEENGKFSIFNTITNLLMIIVILGLDQSYVRYYYEEKEINRGKLLRNCIKIPLIINIVVALIVILFYQNISAYIVQEDSLLVAILLGINLLLSIISRFALLQVRMQQKGKLYSLLNIITKIANLVFVVIIFFIYDDNYMTLILAIVFTNLLILIIAIVIERKEWMRKGTENLKTSQKEILRYGIPLVFSMAITWIFQSIDRMAIKQFSGFTEVGLYNGAMTIISLLNAVQNTFTTFWIPVAFERYSNNSEDRMFFEKVNKIVTLAMLFIAIGLIASKDMIILLLGPQYRDALYIFPYLVFMPIMYTISETTVLGINFKKKPKYHINIAIISAIANLLGNLILVPTYGATGAAISTGIAYIIFFVVRTYYSIKLYKVNYGLGKFTVATILVYILAAYSSFNKFNMVIALLTLINIVVLAFLYRDIILESIQIIKMKINNK